MWLYLYPISDASKSMMRLISREMLGSERITYSTVMVTFVAVACVIGLPRFAITMNEPVIRSEERHLPHGDIRSAIRQRFLRILYATSKSLRCKPSVLDRQVWMLAPVVDASVRCRSGLAGHSNCQVHSRAQLVTRA